jgi:hypothetical protein
MANIGSTDRIFRIVIGAILLIAPFMPPLAGMFAGWGAWKAAVALVGFVLIATALFRFCPLYRMLGITTSGIRKS